VHGLFAMLGQRDATKNKSNEENELSTKHERVDQSPHQARDSDGKKVRTGSRSEAPLPSQEVIEIRISSDGCGKCGNANNSSHEGAPQAQLLATRDSLDIYRRKSEARARATTNESQDSAAGTAMFSRKVSGATVLPPPTSHKQEYVQGDSSREKKSAKRAYSRPKLQRRTALWERDMMASDSVSVATDPAADRDSVISELTDFHRVSLGAHPVRSHGLGQLGPEQEHNVSVAGRSRRYASESPRLDEDDTSEYWLNKPVSLPSQHATPAPYDRSKSTSRRESRECAVVSAAAAAGGVGAIARTSGSDSGIGGSDSSAEVVENNDIVLSASVTSLLQLSHHSQRSESEMMHHDPPVPTAPPCMSLHSSRSSAFVRADDIPVTPSSNVVSLSGFREPEQSILLPTEPGSPGGDDREGRAEDTFYPTQGAGVRHPNQLKSPQKIEGAKILSLELPSASSSMSSWPSKPPPPPPPPHGHTRVSTTTTVTSDVGKEVPSFSQSYGISTPPLTDTAPPLAADADNTKRSQESEGTEYFG
jgi:hypothetical protein